MRSSVNSSIFMMLPTGLAMACVSITGNLDIKVQFGLDGSIYLLPWSWLSQHPEDAQCASGVPFPRSSLWLEHPGAVRHIPHGAKPDAVRERGRDQPDRERGPSVHYRGDPSGRGSAGTAAPA